VAICFYSKAWVVACGWQLAASGWRRELRKNVLDPQESKPQRPSCFFQHRDGEGEDALATAGGTPALRFFRKLVDPVGILADS
jgi:hypothetical protein